ncbi:MAG: hypothetical protein KDB53_21125 [Planctomycetes bacterium]|nr:hypothetical protein [Planctomycetota bacterium]
MSSRLIFLVLTLASTTHFGQLLTIIQVDGGGVASPTANTITGTTERMIRWERSSSSQSSHSIIFSTSSHHETLVLGAAMGSTVTGIFCPTGEDVPYEIVDSMSVTTGGGLVTFSGKCAPEYPGGEAKANLLTRSAVNDPTVATDNGTGIRYACDGDIVTTENISTSGTYDFALYYLFGSVFPTAATPTPLFGNLWTGPGTVVLVSGSSSAPFPIQMVPGGLIHHYIVPPGFAGNSFMVQGLVLAFSVATGVPAAFCNAVEFRII